MKRPLALLVVFCLSLLLCAPAFATAAQPFSLRNGYTWGISTKDALALTKEDGIVMESLYGTGRHFTATNVPVGHFIASRFSLFFREVDGELQLYSMSYEFDAPEEEDEERESFAEPYQFPINELKYVLDSLYGVSTLDRSFVDTYTWDLGHTTVTLRDTEKESLSISVPPEGPIRLCAIYYLQKTPPVQ